jgi:hypothetical protein
MDFRFPKGKVTGIGLKDLLRKPRELIRDAYSGGEVVKEGVWGYPPE